MAELRRSPCADALVQHAGWAFGCGSACTLFSIWLLPGFIGASLAVGQGLIWTALLLDRQPRAANFVLLGITAGFVELLADLWLVRIDALVYPEDGPFILASPAYMPIAWYGMLVSGMALSIALRSKLSPLATSLVVALAFGSYVPAYEWLALHAHWWHYRHPELLLGAVPPPIVLGEVFIALPLTWLADRMQRGGPWAAVGYGIAEGLWILVSYRIAWFVAG